MQISNGAGGAVSNAGVDSHNRLLTYATSRPENLAYTFDNRAYSVFVNVTPSNGANIFFMLGTNTSTQPIVVNWINLTCASTEVVDLLVGQYITPSVSGATSDVPINKNVFTAKACPWTANIGSTMSTLATLSNMDSIQLNPTYPSPYPTSIIIQPGYCLALRTISGLQAIRGSVHFYLLEGTSLGSWSE